MDPNPSTTSVVNCYMSFVKSKSLFHYSLPTLRKIAELVNIEYPPSSDALTLYRMIRSTCKEELNSVEKSEQEVLNDLDRIVNRETTIKLIGRLLNNGVIGEYEDNDLDTFKEVFLNHRLLCEDTFFEGEIHLVDTAFNAKKRIGHYLHIDDPPSKKIKSVKLVSPSNKATISSFYNDLTYSLQQKEIEQDATMVTLLATNKHLEEEVARLKKSNTLLEQEVKDLNVKKNTQ